MKFGGSFYKIKSPDYICFVNATATIFLSFQAFLYSKAIQ